LIELILSAEGFTVICSKNGDDGLEMAQYHQPSIIIVDAELPKMSGYMLAVLLRQHELTRHIPIIMLGELPAVSTGIPFKQPTPYRISKPIQPQQLTQLIWKLVS
jgi:CheY-like chemotaxis protein